jgi:hypothetical protein
MSDPPRLLAGADGLDPEERRALEAGRRLRPPRAHRALVLGAVLAQTGLAAASGAGAASAVVVGKWVAVGMVAGAVAMAGSGLLFEAEHERQAPVAQAASAPNVRPAPLPPAPLPPAAISNEPGDPEVTPPEDAPTPLLPVKPAKLSASSETAPDALGAARAEAQAVKEARARLREGDAHGAYARLRRLASEQPRGTLVEEREALTIEALAMLGQKTAARERAESFAELYPLSPYLARVRAAGELEPLR